MEEEMEKLLDERVGPRWREWGRENLLRHVYETSYLLDSDPGVLTVTAARMVSIYKAEQGRIRRTEDWNRRQAMRNKSKN